MFNVIKCRLACLILLMVLLSSTVIADDSKPVYTPNWDSLAKHEAVPEWFKDAKFGIYFHWGPYSVPAVDNTKNGDVAAEWYPRWMHWNFEDDPQHQAIYKYHLQHYGNPNEFGYHDLIPLFKGEKFDADAWAELFDQAGARFAGPVAEHHDGFAMWDSKITPWNSVDMGPKRDIIGELAKAIRDKGMKLITTFHHAKNLQRYADSPEELTRKDLPQGWRFRNSQYPYIKGMPTASEDKNLRLLYGNMPEDIWVERMWFGKLKEVIDDYQPDLIWFDLWLDLIPEDYLQKFSSYYLNSAKKWGKDVAIIRKQNDLPDSFTIEDFEKGRTNRLTENVWLTDDTISGASWSYTRDMTVKSAPKILHTLIDIVSKNGLLLLNISPRADGSIPDQQRQVLLGVGNWLKVNGEAIYNTRPWKVFGEGPSRLARSGSLVGDLKYSAADIRFTTAGPNILYAIALGKPDKGVVTIKSLSKLLTLYEGEIGDVEFVGSNQAVQWKHNNDGLDLTVPKDAKSDVALVWKIIKKEKAAQCDHLSEDCH